MISADVTFFKSALYSDKEGSKSTSLEKTISCFFYNSFSYVNVNPMLQRYGQAYTRRVKSTIDVPIVLVSPIIDTIYEQKEKEQYFHLISYQ